MTTPDKPNEETGKVQPEDLQPDLKIQSTIDTIGEIISTDPVFMAITNVHFHNLSKPSPWLFDPHLYQLKQWEIEHGKLQQKVLLEKLRSKWKKNK